MTILKKKSAEKWKNKDILLITKLIARWILIDATGNNYSNANTFRLISKKFTNYVVNYPKIWALINLIYVFINLPDCYKLTVSIVSLLKVLLITYNSWNGGDVFWWFSLLLQFIKSFLKYY
jgi:hypothetical protein